MKVTLLCLIFFGVLAISLAQSPLCNKQSDCEEDECCLDNLFYRRPYCAKRYRPGVRCPAFDTYDEKSGLFKLACPCVDKYECLGKGTVENGKTVMKDAKCIMPTK